MIVSLKKDNKTKYNIINNLLKDGDIIGGVSMLLRDLPYDKNNIQNYFLLGQSYLFTKNYYSAIKYFLKYVDLVSTNVNKAKGLYACCMCAVKLDNMELLYSFYKIASKFFDMRCSEYEEEIFQFLDKNLDEPLFKVVEKKDDYESVYLNACKYTIKKNYDLAIKEFLKIPKESKFYVKSLEKIGKNYYFMGDNEKAHQYLSDYFYNYNPSISSSVKYLSFLYENYPDEFEKGKQILLSKKVSKDEAYVIAEFFLSICGDYKNCLLYTNIFLSQEPYCEHALFVSAYCYFCLKEYEKSLQFIKNAYLLSHSDKIKHVYKIIKDEILNKTYNIDKIFEYPSCKYKENFNFLSDIIQSNKKLKKINAKQILELINYAYELEDNNFWSLLIDVIYLSGKKSILNLYQDILANYNIDLEIKFMVLEKLALLNEKNVKYAYLSEYVYEVKFYDIEKFNSLWFTQAYAFGYARYFMAVEDNFLEKCIELENILINKNFVSISKEDLSGLILYYTSPTLRKGKLPFYKICKTTKTKAEKLYKIIKASTF